MAAALTALALLAACSDPTADHHHAPHRQPSRPGDSASAAPSDSATVASPPPCRVTYRAPAPHRPRVRLRFDVEPGLATVTGTEHVVLTPDLPVREMVFRLTANTPSSYLSGSSITVTSARVDGAPVRRTFDLDGAVPTSQGGLLRLRLPRPVPAGHPVTADLSFALTLGGAGFDRFGRAHGVAWWGSGQPLLAWEDGVGWHTEPLAQIPAESATSEAADTDLQVTAPAADTVIGTGHLLAAPARDDRRTWRSTEPAARDVVVTVGRLAASSVDVGGTRVTVASWRSGELTRLRALQARAVRALTALYGPFPFRTLDVTSLPTDGGGIEYPAAILLAGVGSSVLTHETAHQWFYAMVGDSQARDPWLDEAFAEFSERLVDGHLRTAALTGRAPVGGSLRSWGSDSAAYYATVYGKGAAMLTAARRAAGAAPFDAALRCYLRVRAWTIARPDDVRDAFGRLPAVLAVLTRAGAIG